MLKEVKIAGCASYDAAGETMADLKPINFIFGTNGTGKTTISRVIADVQSFAASSLNWEAGRVLDTLVYNRDFAAQNFANSTAPGIFTLGTVDPEIDAKIVAATNAITEHNQKIAQIEGTLDGPDRQSGKRGELAALRNEIEEQCWHYKKTHDAHFAGAFEGLRSKKALFCDQMLAKHGEAEIELHALDDLKARAATVFEEGLELVAPIGDISFTDIIALESNPILGKKVIGKEDVDIAALIKRLGNSDWVKAGLPYVAKSDDPCPFCQQALPANLLAELNGYFDETYLADMAEIQRLATAYDGFGRGLSDRLASVRDSENRYLDTQLFSAEIDRLSDRLALNARHIEQKRKEASAPVTLEPLGEIAAGIQALITAANEKIASHNLTFANITAERATLTNEIWRCLTNDADAIIRPYLTKKGELDRAVEGLIAGIEDRKNRRRQAKIELNENEQLVTSVQPTVTEINATLASFGFNSFKLATAGERDNQYRVSRADGSDAANTLSEGEKSFITFLYFYHLIRGSITQSGINTDRIVVIDDPVSSLDTDVLFIVSTLIRRLMEEVRRGGRIKQVTVLTHNIYFHKEVSYEHSRAANSCFGHESFWVVRKGGDGHSKIIRHASNPVKTSYELLWSEVRNPDRSKVTIQNTLRRIVENYFKILGNMDFDAISSLFEGQDQLICKSLFTWLHDGSHSFNDDLYVSADDAMIDRYLNVFREIFDKTEHMAHYRMMMGEDNIVQIPVAAVPVEAQQPAVA